MKQEVDFDELFDNKLKKLSVSELEDIISLAIGDAIGQKLDSSIIKIDYSEPIHASTRAKLTISITKKVDTSGF
ncbi:hypothetical protein [Aeromonas sp. 603696]|uniref:hypothetical protein n=1 Tax=Aeromonas sp. 603696 TaxID=2712049 RepID=UPI003BA0A126